METLCGLGTRTGIRRGGGIVIYKRKEVQPGRGAPLFFSRERITLQREPRQQEPPVQEPQQREQQPSQRRAYVNDGS